MRKMNPVSEINASETISRVACYFAGKKARDCRGGGDGAGDPRNMSIAGLLSVAANVNGGQK